MNTPPETCCFLSGTLIATLQGPRPVELLQYGDLVITSSGEALPVKWIGTQEYIGRLLHRYDLQHLMPVCIAANSLGDGCPARDLFVSPEHKLHIGEWLVPAEAIANAMSITRALIDGPIRYFHVELPRHSIIYAEGAAVESFVVIDAAGYNKFTNVLDAPEAAGFNDPAPLTPCLPVLGAGEALDGIRARLAARAEALGFATTTQKDLRLSVDGVELRPTGGDDLVARFTVPAGARQIRILSRSVAPAEIIQTSGDRRRLGVCLTGMTLRNSQVSLELAPDYPGFARSFHDIEDPQRRWRWTDGNAALPPELIALMSGGFTLELRLTETGLRYPCAVPVPTYDVT